MGGLGRFGLNSDQRFFLRSNNVKYSHGIDQIQSREEECKHIRTYQFRSDIVLVWNYVTRFRRKQNKKENSRITSTCRFDQDDDKTFIWTE